MPNVIIKGSGSISADSTLNLQRRIYFTPDEITASLDTIQSNQFDSINDSILAASDSGLTPFSSSDLLSIFFYTAPTTDNATVFMTTFFLENTVGNQGQFSLDGDNILLGGVPITTTGDILAVFQNELRSMPGATVNGFTDFLDNDDIELAFSQEMNTIILDLTVFAIISDDLIKLELPRKGVFVGTPVADINGFWESDAVNKGSIELFAMANSSYNTFSLLTTYSAISPDNVSLENATQLATFIDNLKNIIPTVSNGVFATLFDLSVISVSYSIIGDRVLASENFASNTRNTLKVESFNIKTDQFIENDVFIFENGVIFSLFIKMPNINGYNSQDIKTAMEPNTPTTINLIESLDTETNQVVLECQLVEDLNLVVTL